ncbi:MAG: V-type ATP synthase subunit I [Treponema sp.]|nr:V-type ATP synthase subunit I [Treponema sp.]
MKKVCLMVQDSERNEALLKLRKVGVIHLEKSNAPADGCAAVTRKNKLESAMGLIGDIKIKTDKNKIKTEPEQNLPDLIVDVGRQRKELQERNMFLHREISRIEAWGNFNPASLKEMASLGQPLFLYEFTKDAFAEIDLENVRFIKTGGGKNAVRLVVLDKEIAGVAPFQLPEKSLSELIRETEENKIALNKLEEKLKTLAEHRQALITEMKRVEQEIEFESASASMEKVEDVPVEHGLSWLTGYVPAPDMESLKAIAGENGWALSANDPEETDETVPTKLKNSKFVNLLTPITDFLGIVPGYREVDISLWFLIFFCIFFGMLFGDAAYGLIISTIAIVGIIKTAKKGVPIGLQMLLLLGVFNTTWGVMTCSWFGVDSEKVPQILQDISLSYISTAKSDPKLVDQNLQIFCFSLGLLQLTIAHLKGIIRYIKSLRVFAEIGSIAMLWGMYNVVLFLVVSNDTRAIPLLPPSVYLLGGGFALTFVFGSYEGSIGQSILSSFKNIISVVLGITNVFSDIMSYIRLWAVGLAGASIATTVNTMAGPLLGNFLIFAGIILLVFGHGLNLILNVLSVLVHGVRLNTLEFSGHVGLTWSGTAYRPFAERAVK